jgi:hypothetical protein
MVTRRVGGGRVAAARWCFKLRKKKNEKPKKYPRAEDGIRTRASEEIAALTRRLRPTRPPPRYVGSYKLRSCRSISTRVA